MHHRLALGGAALLVAMIVACGGGSDADGVPKLEPDKAVEAESAQIVPPMRVVMDDAASGRSYVEQDRDVTVGALVFRAQVPETGPYRLKGRVRTGENGADSFTVRLGTAPPIAWTLPAETRDWEWVEGPEVWLTAGDHDLRVEYREANVGIDAIELQTTSGAGGASYDVSGRQLYVSTKGKDNNSGDSDSEPFRTISRALAAAQPGDMINLADGEYFEDVKTVRDGLPGAPITVRGSADAVLKGGGNARVFQIEHSYITLEGFTIDGLWDDPTSPKGYRDKLIYVQGTAPLIGLEGIVVRDMELKNAGGECLRLRYFVRLTEIASNRIGPCGVYDFAFPSKEKNGEGIYIGTSSRQWGDGKNPTAGPDGSSNNWVHDNQIRTDGNECVEVKEGAFGNLIENNVCSGQRDPKSGGFGARGDDNIFRGNTTTGNEGAGFRLGGHRLCLNPRGEAVFDFETDGGRTCEEPNVAIEYGKNNQVYGNYIRENANNAIAIEVIPQTAICGNESVDNQQGDSGGEFGKQFAPSAPC